MTKTYEKLKELRKKLNLSQEFVAKQLNISRTTITAIESGRRKIEAEELRQFSILYGVTADELLNEENANVNAVMFARAFSSLHTEDQEEIMGLINLKKRIKGVNDL